MARRKSTHAALQHTPEELVAIAHADAAVENGNIADARKFLADAGIILTHERMLTWAERIERGMQRTARDIFCEVYDDAVQGDPASPISVRADAGARRCFVAAGELDDLIAWLHRPNWNDLNAHRGVMERDDAPTPIELRAIAAVHGDVSDPKDVAMVRHIARTLKDRAMLRALYRSAVHSGEAHLVDDLAAELGRAPSRRDRLAVARALIRASGAALRNSAFAVQYIQTHDLRELVWEALRYAARWQGWTTIRSHARMLRFTLREQHLAELVDAFVADDSYRVLAELARKYPKRWRTRYHNELARDRDHAVAQGEVSNAARIARMQRRPLTIAECTVLLAKNPVKPNDPQYRTAYRDELERHLLAAAEREGKRRMHTLAAARAA